MPTYEYECQDCKCTFDEYQKITASALEVCPKCKGKVKRLISGGAGVLYKGSGFYTTDYRNSDYKQKAKEDSVPSSGSCPNASPGSKCGSCPSNN